MSEHTSQRPPDEPAAAHDEPDDVEGHRMLSPAQAQHRSDMARIERELRQNHSPFDEDDVTG